MKKHHIWMVVACVIPLLLFFALPTFGVRGNFSYLLLLVGCFAMHLFMSHGHDDNDKGGGHDSH